ncbi:MAG: NADP-dependent oxidoreductase [Kofleriaceae bacterium]|nr:NADP-dependent oxidoreductase [Myxococcales bacterium]MCB9560049.1 NADP-dependent oxidoreductase [Kofleriaceae bacterium]MCB9571898.1 NADP-dependent oxidoreductase [Kofleriaceae bacterium]
MTTTNAQILLASRPDGEPTLDNFRLVETPIPTIGDGQVLVRNRFLSLDPYMRGRMSDAKSYAAPQPLDQVMLGGTAGEVVESRDPGFAAGDQVVGFGGWQQYVVVTPSRGGLQKVDTTHVPLSAYLGPVGMPGVTAWYGLTRIIAPKAGETVVVSAASGAVGSVVGQLAKLRGARAVGIAGGPTKCGYVVDELGFDACVDYKAHREVRDLARALKEACPDGIDGDFENVGGTILDAIMLRANAFARVALCGMIAGYNGAPIPMAMPQLLLTNRMKLEGFIVSEHMDAWPAALQELGGLVATGKLRYTETIAEGLEAAPEAFLGLLRGRNLGKQLVRLS